MVKKVVGSDIAPRVHMRVEMSAAYPSQGTGTIIEVLFTLCMEGSVCSGVELSIRA